MMINGKWHDNITCPKCRARHPGALACADALLHATLNRDFDKFMQPERPVVERDVYVEMQALVETYGAACADVARNPSHESARAYREWARSSLMDAIKAL